MAETDAAIAAAQSASTPTSTLLPATVGFTQRPKLHGRAFYEAIGSPKYIVAPMVDRSEFAWRLLTRSYLDPTTNSQLLAYTPMLHARLFSQASRFRDEHFQPLKSSLETASPPPPSINKPFLDGNPAIDRPLFVQFCANKPAEFLTAAQYVAPYCDAVDLNLGCPQGIARSGKYGAFLQEDWDTIYNLINTLHKELDVPITAKMRILETKEETLEYAKMILSAGASILTVHGRRREQKGHNTGLADWEMIRFLRDSLPKDTVLFANGNILNGGDLEECLKATGADGVMSAEGNLSDPTVFAQPPETGSEYEKREYWRSSTDEKVGGYRLDGVIRRYLDIIYKYVLEKEPPKRKPLWILEDGDPEVDSRAQEAEDAHAAEREQPPKKKQKRDSSAQASPNLRVMQGHLFGLLRPMLSTHTDIRDTLARTRTGEIEGFEKVLSMVEEVVKKGLREDAEKQRQQNEHTGSTQLGSTDDKLTPSQKTTAKYGRPWWVAQPHIRPLPEEAIALGALTVSKNKAKLNTEKKLDSTSPAVRRTEDPKPVEVDGVADETKQQLPQSALVCG